MSWLLCGGCLYLLVDWGFVVLCVGCCVVAVISCLLIDVRCDVYSLRCGSGYLLHVD